MATTENKLIRDLVGAIKDGTKEKTKAYETPATVTRIEDGVAWVHVPGGVEETPVQMTISAKEGDQVRVRVANGRATIVGNVTNPPTDDATAMKALSNANIAYQAARSASAAASSAEASATTAKEYAEAAKDTTDEINAYAETVGKTVTQVLEDGETAGAAAEQAKTSADTAWANLSQVQSVLEVAQWIATHGTYVKATTFNPNATYYTLTATQVATPSDDDKDSQGVLIYYELDSGIYVRTTDTSVDDQKTYYRVTGTPVSQPSAEHIADYYTLAVTDAMADYIQAHLALTSEGLYVTKDGSEWKVQIADDGVYILDPNNEPANQMTGSGNSIGYDDETHVEIDYHSLQLIARGETTPYFWVSDLRDKNDDYQATITETFRADGATNTFSVQLDVSAEVSATDSTHSSNTATRSGQEYTFATTPSEGATITIVYKTTSEKAKAYTLGLRESGIVGAMSVAEGNHTIASGYVSHAEGSYTTASGYVSHAEGSYTTASGYASYAEGSYTTASGHFSHAEGYNTTASGNNSYAEGDNTKASGEVSHAEGYYTTASGYDSHAEGYNTIASGSSSHAEGMNTKASGHFSHAEGDNTKASGEVSHAEGDNTTASGNNSHAQNSGTIAQRRSQTALGEYNISDTQGADGTVRGKFAVIVGNGTGYRNRSNGLAVTWDGNVEMALDTTAQSGVDKEIYDALVNLGWDSDVII